MFDFLFATFLYTAIFCFVCCLRYQPSCAVKMATDTPHLPKEEPQPASLNQVSTTELEQMPESANVLIETETTSHLPVTQYTEEASEPEDSQLTSLSTGNCSHLTVPDPSKLTLRQCRAVIRAINKGLPQDLRRHAIYSGKELKPPKRRRQTIVLLSSQGRD
jgi:hypothetical protein